MISKEQEQEKKDKQTCLYDKHVELGALMSPFAHGRGDCTRS